MYEVMLAPILAILLQCTLLQYVPQYVKQGLPSASTPAIKRNNHCLLITHFTPPPPSYIALSKLLCYICSQDLHENPPFRGCSIPADK